jgi:hypothetical protein
VKNKSNVTVLIFILLAFTKVSFANTLLFVAENLPPYHYLDINDQPNGFLVDVVVKA